MNDEQSTTIPAQLKTTNDDDDDNNNDNDNDNGNTLSPHFGQRHITNFESSLKLHANLVEQSTNNKSRQYISQSLQTLHSTFRLYQPENVCVAFNGGKDATVVLYLTLAVLSSFKTSTKLHCIYLIGDNDNNFEQVNAFVKTTVENMHQILYCDSVHMDMKSGIESFIQSRKNNTTCCAFVMGTRRTDPHGQYMERFEPSTPDWPPFMRINPILDWTYHNVWDFLLGFKLPFCKLYTQGYTSLGSVATTFPNPALKRIKNKNTNTANSDEKDKDKDKDNDGDNGDDKINSEKNGHYHPAWMLEDESLERAGRIKKKKPS